MNSKKHKLFLLTLTATAVLSLSGCTQSSAKEQPAKEKTVEEKTGSNPFAEMETTDLDGNSADSSIFTQNKLTLVNVWNVGCTPCVQEIPVLDQLNKEYADKGVAIKGLYYDLKEGISDEARSEAAEILSTANADYQQLLISKEMLNSDVLRQLTALPTTFFIDSKGNIINTIMGSNDYEGWKEVIEASLKQVEGDA